MKVTLPTQTNKLEYVLVQDGLWYMIDTRLRGSKTATTREEFVVGVFKTKKAAHRKAIALLKHRITYLKKYLKRHREELAEL